jgi:hypothetical protein
MPGKPEDQIAAYRADPARLMLDAGFQPDPWQREFLTSADRWNLILCARQVGKSLTVSILALHTALTRPNSTTVIIAPIEPQANELLRKVMTTFNKIGRPMGVKREAVTTLELVNNARIIALPGKERSVHSYTADLLIIDEAARVPDEVYHAASPQLSASKGRLVALSTAFAKSGWFYKEWCEGLGYRKWSITARECPRHTPEFLERERRSMGDRWFAMAYLNLFGDGVAAVYRAEDIARARTPDVKSLFGSPRSDTSKPAGGDPTVKPLFVK